MARAILPVNLYTEWYWKNDLHNLLHFIGLRSDSHAQYEIRVFSDAMASFFKKDDTHAREANQDYAVLDLRFSKIEKKIKEYKTTDKNGCHCCENILILYYICSYLSLFVTFYMVQI